eukprot:2476894-Pyramimonas_sp.AAC.1
MCRRRPWTSRSRSAWPSLPRGSCWRSARGRPRPPSSAGARRLSGLCGPLAAGQQAEGTCATLPSRRMRGTASSALAGQWSSPRVIC